MFSDSETPLKPTAAEQIHKRNVRSIEAIDIAIGKRIEERRVIAGYSRKELARKLGITHQQLHKYERGANRITASRLHAIAHLLGTSVADFYEKESLLTSQELTAAYKDALHALRDFMRIRHPRQKEVITLLIKILAES
ncbi:MAG: XRE family transcriptional regulator [Proteobacteria bacterium]|nr:XRE family transcriptional regulator [Pseudomonadota bacterium]